MKKYIRSERANLFEPNVYISMITCYVCLDYLTVIKSTQAQHLSAFLASCSHEKTENKGLEPMLTDPDWKSQYTDRHKY